MWVRRSPLGTLPKRGVEFRKTYPRGDQRRASGPRALRFFPALLRSTCLRGGGGGGGGHGPRAHCQGHSAKSGLPRAFPQDQEPGFQTHRTPSSLRDHPVGFRPPRPQGPPEGWAGQARRGLLRGPEKEVDSGAKEVTHRSDFVPPAFIRQPPVRPGRASPSGRTRHLPHLTRSFRRNQ